MSKPRFVTLSAMVLIAALSRLMPHPWNMTPIPAMALFSGAYFAEKKWGLILSLAAMFVSDIFLGFYAAMWVTYAAFALIALLGLSLRENKSFARITMATSVGAVIFFVLTNTAAWATMPEYPKTFQGLEACFTLAIPFFRNTLIGDVFYTALLFGGFAFAERRFPALQQHPV